MQKPFPSFSASQVCLMPFSSSTSLIRFMGLSIILYRFYSRRYKILCNKKVKKRVNKFILHLQPLVILRRLGSVSTSVSELSFAKQVPDRCCWMINHHPRSGPAHNGADTLPHFIIVAVDWAFAASGLVGTETAAVEAVESVVEQFAAGRT